MKRIATPMIGGVVTSTLMELAVYPAIFFVWRSRKLERQAVSPTTVALPA
jgi:Cu(I)/Ag(I) efflux system membrane protein CusA/SilA